MAPINKHQKVMLPASLYILRHHSKKKVDRKKRQKKTSIAHLSDFACLRNYESPKNIILVSRK